jgi:phage-related protein (TIGR01555 family)
MGRKKSNRQNGAQRRNDGYSNMLNRYGTKQDNSTAYRYQSDGLVPDIVLTEHYSGNGLFATIIDAPSEEAVKHGFELDGEQPDAEELLGDALDALDWDEKAATALKWTRLYGGAIIVMLIDDGGGLDEPLNRAAIQGIDGIRVHERAIVQPDWATVLYGEPQYYDVSSTSGFYRVHASRCLVFKNGTMPDQTFNTQYRFWGLPEYARIRNELRECVTSHGLGVKLLDRAIQAVYAMKGLAQKLSTDAGEDEVLRRIQIIDKARGILNSIAIDADGESYEFKSMSFAGVKDIIDSTCNLLSAVSRIPQTILFGRSPAGENSTGESDFENYYNLCERLQRIMLRPNLKTLADVIFSAAVARGDLAEKPPIKITFKPLWSLSDKEQAEVEATRATASFTKAQTAQVYFEIGSLDAPEIRRGLAKNKEFEIEKMLDDLPDEDLSVAFNVPPPVVAPTAAPTPGEPQAPTPPPQVPAVNADGADTSAGVGVIVLNDTGELVLCGKRSDNGTVGGPGGHIQEGESPIQAAIRETQEEFGITPLSLKRLGRLADRSTLTGYGNPHIFLCTEYEGEPVASDEMKSPVFFPLDEFEPEDVKLFPPFEASLEFLGDL